jgi:phosphatidylglycerophosphate synthase
VTTAGPVVRGLADPARERWATLPNKITLVRTCLAMGLGAWALAATSLTLIVAGYVAYWCGDILDGLVARRLDQETRIGAVADIVCDRLCTFALAAALVVTLPWTVLPVAVFLVQFAAVDLALSLTFLRWPILSPNYFYLVDRPLYVWNWSPLAKGLNTSSVVLTTVLTGSAVLGALVAGVGLAVKLCGARRMARLVARLGRTGRVRSDVSAGVTMALP